MLPYDAPMIVRLLRAMSDEKLATVTWQQFQMHPAPCITKGAIQDTLYGDTKLNPEADGRCLRGLRNRGLVEGEKPHVYLTDAGKGVITDIEGRVG